MLIDLTFQSDSVMHLYSEDDYQGDSNVVVVQPEDISSDPTTGFIVIFLSS